MVRLILIFGGWDVRHRVPVLRYAMSGLSFLWVFYKGPDWLPNLVFLDGKGRGE